MSFLAVELALQFPNWLEQSPTKPYSLTVKNSLRGRYFEFINGSNCDSLAADNKNFINQIFANGPHLIVHTINQRL